MDDLVGRHLQRITRKDTSQNLRRTDSGYGREGDLVSQNEHGVIDDLIAPARYRDATNLVLSTSAQQVRPRRHRIRAVRVERHLAGLLPLPRRAADLADFPCAD